MGWVVGGKRHDPDLERGSSANANDEASLFQGLGARVAPMIDDPEDRSYVGPMPKDQESVINALHTVVDPEVGKPITALNMVRDVDVTADYAAFTIALHRPGASLRQKLEPLLREALKPIEVPELRISWDLDIPARSILQDDMCPGVKNIVLVMSGKGGVGKSTVSANLALALNQLGARVGLLDADMYGPSIPTMFGVAGRPTSSDGVKFSPLERFNVKLMSIGFLLEDPKSAVVWRGPMLQNALIQFLKDVDWGELDYLVLDMPPGTGDVALTISQKTRSTGGVIVTTPQEVALQDVYKSVSMAQKVGIPLLGVVENESYFICDGCDKRHELFGAGGGQKVAAFANAPLLGQLPIDPLVRQWGDEGTPVVQASPGSSIAKAFVEVSEALASRVSAHNFARGTGLKIDRSGGVQRHLPIAR